MRCSSLRFPSLLVSAIVALLVQPVSAADDWVDSFYQFRLPVEFEADAAGWQVWPIDAERITREINRVGHAGAVAHDSARGIPKVIQHNKPSGDA